MQQPEEMIAAVRAALEKRREINLHESPIELSVREGVVVMRGEVRDIIAKRVARLAAVEALGVDHVLDELCMAPAERRSDAQIVETLERMLMSESAFRDYPRTVVTGAHPQPPAGASPGEGAIGAAVQDGVVTLQGTVGSLTHRRLADVLAWWTPGSRCVHNYLHVVPQERDSDAEVSDALRVVFDKNPWLDAGAIRVRVKERVVTLEGVVSSRELSRMAERDAWYVLGVHGVDNRLQVEAPEA
ncbi:MAG: BON domain-containing protein [Gammaproteobacteria bacterium]|jgi:osmotically-inducible protein OsmY